MVAPGYDIITVGGGIAGSSLALAMAGRGAKVLVLEREKQFRDRVRGEALVPWGVAEASELGISDLLKERRAHDVPYVEGGSGLRDLRATTPQQSPLLSFPHHVMQETLLAAAENAGAKSVGPLASFDASDDWVEHPYRDGVALVGDAAATTDPTYDQGLSFALLAARAVRDELTKDSDWEAAGHRYADQHQRCFRACHSVEGWLRTLFQDPSAEAAALWARALPRISEDPTRVPDHIMSGPDLPLDEHVRARFFGEC
jgi:2-polyprenyl-6-methoxyphenol hydroxylase-like FAD-dependent oxidoreductase